MHSCNLQYEISSKYFPPPPSDGLLVALYEVKYLNTLCGDHVCPSACNIISATKLYRIFVKFGL